MSRTHKGSKPVGYDFTKRRLGNEGHGGSYGPFAKKMTHHRERLAGKIEIDKSLPYNDSTKDHPNIIEYFDKQGIQIEIMAQHPLELDVIFDKVTDKWLGYVSDFCFNHNTMYCEKCYENYEEYYS